MRSCRTAPCADNSIVTDPPYRIVSERLVIRCWEPRDATLLKEAIDSSLDELRPWMVWARSEPQPLSEKVALLRRFRGQFDLGRDFVYGIFDGRESEVVGGTGLHTRDGQDAYEIGYWIRTGRTGSGLATEAAAALTRVAFELCGVDRVDIRVEPDNLPSITIPRKLGFVEEGTLRRRLPGPADGEPRDVTLFALFRDGYAGSPASSTTLEAYDAAGSRVL
jgi:RimJ/RimL family protein N-acetyltransferase